MAVTRGQRITRAQLDALTNLAQTSPALEGKPYQFLPRVWIINDASVSAQPPWTTASRNRLAGIQVGDVVVNIRRPAINIAFKLRYADIWQLARLPVGGIQSTVLGDWRSLRNGSPPSPAWRTVHDFVERDSNEVTNTALANFGYGLLTAGAVADGTIIVVVDNQNGATQGAADNWNLNNLRPRVQVRRGNAWHDYSGWAGELSRLRFAMGRQFNAGDPAAVSGQFGLTDETVISEPYQIFPIQTNFFTFHGYEAGVAVAGFFALDTFLFPQLGVLEYKDIQCLYTEALPSRFRRTIIPPVSYAGSGVIWRSGFQSFLNVPGNFTWGAVTSGFRGRGTDAGGVLRLFTPAPQDLVFTLTGTLSPYATVVNQGSRFKATINAPGLAAGEWWLSYTLTLNATCGSIFGPLTNCDWDPAPGTEPSNRGTPDGKFYTIDNVVTGPEYPQFITYYAADSSTGSEGLPALHTSKRIYGKNFIGETVTMMRLTGASAATDDPANNFETPHPFKANQTIACAQYFLEIVQPPEGAMVMFIARSRPIGSNVMEPTVGAVPRPIRQFAPHQFDYVPPAGELVAQGQKGLYRRVVSTQSRGPYLWPNADGQGTDNGPTSTACRTYPTMRDPVAPADYVAFSTLVGFGQIIQIKAIRKGDDDGNGTNIVTVLGPEVTVHVGCYRAGVFVSLAQVTIAANKIAGTWQPAAGQPGIPVFEFFPLVAKCDSDVMVYPTWFNAGARTGLGDGSLREGDLTAVSAPIMADHYNDTESLLNLLQDDGF